MKKSIVKAYVMLVMVFWLVADVTVEAAPSQSQSVALADIQPFRRSGCFPLAHK